MAGIGPAERTATTGDDLVTYGQRSVGQTFAEIGPDTRLSPATALPARIAIAMPAPPVSAYSQRLRFTQKKMLITIVAAMHQKYM